MAGEGGEGLGPDTPKHKCPPDPTRGGGSPKGVRGPRVFSSSSTAAAAAAASLVKHGSVALPVLFDSHDAERLHDAFLHSSPESEASPLLASPPPSYSSVLSCEPLSSVKPAAKTNNSKHHHRVSVPIPVLSSVPLVGSPSSISTASSRSSSTSSSSSDESCFSDDGTSVADFDAVDYLESVLLPAASLLAHESGVKPFADDVWHGAVVSDAVERSNTLVVSLAGGDHEGLRERVVELLEKADEEHACASVVICLSKEEPCLADLIHSLLYVGGAVVAPDHPRFAHSDAHVLVGLEL